MKPAVVAGAVLLVAAVGVGAHSLLQDDDKPTSSRSHPLACTAADATSASRVTISHHGLDLSCVAVARKAGFTLLNVDAKLHDFSTTQGAPAPLRVELKKGAAFPYRFTKAGTYRLEDTKSDLVLTVIVR